ncbi:thiamine-phosphate kinase [Sulfuriferula thiophila]|uniref:thiamine-phosphate kinase n=1 Tax=Sulfuriferula thiophila TaxID=1781211 RepID=UPI000F607AFD|nr:thiamine-phosphate kinase [Sulfuriferula thiophila]
MSSEFDLIRQYFSRPAPDAILGAGDDCALLQVTPGMLLAVSTDTLVAGVHFFPDADPALLGWKSLAVNLSDLAAMGATPRWATLAITLPEVDDEWLAAYADGLYRCAAQHHISLVGGDTTRGALCMTLTVMGEVPPGAALRRDGAQAGDTVWVSGCLGDAAFALAAIQGHLNLSDTDFATLSTRLHAPVPRVALGLALRQIASSAIDLSDGLLADLGHILERSQVGAELDYTQLPVSELVHDLAAHPAFDRCVLAGGDDYELCFTAPADKQDAITAIGASLGLRLTAIGQISAEAGLRVTDGDGLAIALDSVGYDHFAS